MNIALVAPHGLHIKLFWSDLILELLRHGHSVFVYAPEDESKKEIEDLGATFRPSPMHRFLNPIKDLQFMLFLTKAFRQDGIEIVSNFTVKPNVFGAIAAYLAPCPRIYSMVLGLGTVFTTNTLRSRMIRIILMQLYRVGFLCASKVCFVNSDDQALALRRMLLTKKKALLIKSGIGVNLDKFSPSRVQSNSIKSIREECSAGADSIIVLMMSRLLWGKGIREFCEASQLLASELPQVKFVLVGGPDASSPDAVPDSYIAEQQSKGLIFLGFRKDIPELLAAADIFTLPSFYGEGLPQVLLEAMAMEKPLVSTDNVGCRDAVDDNKNGYLIPTQSSSALADAVRKLALDPERRRAFGLASREKVEREFEKKDILARLLKEWYQLPPSNPPGH